MSKPRSLSLDDLIADPALCELANGARSLLDMNHTEAIASRVARSPEHICSLSPWAKEMELSNQLVLHRYGASAFDDGTVQDLKYHRYAHEIYLVLKGCLRILWKDSGNLPLNNTLDLSCEGQRCAVIPPGHCLVVLPVDRTPFLAVAFKSLESNKGNGGKQAGSSCLRRRDCPDSEVCERIEQNRGSFFGEMRGARESAVQRLVKLLGHTNESTSG